MTQMKNTIKTAGFMIIATLLAKLAGMGRDVLLASLYGTGGQAAAFTTASRIPLLFFDITLGAAISSSFIPVYNEYLESGETKQAAHYANTFITVIVLITAVFCAVGMLFPKQIVGFIGEGLGEAEQALAAQLVVILFPTMLFTALAYALTGILQSLGEFNVPAAISLVSNGIMMLYLWCIKDKLGIQGVAVAMLVAWSFQVFVQLPSLHKKQFRYRPALHLNSEGMKKTVALALPILISSWVQPINTTVNLRLASFLNNGHAVAAIDYANKLYIICVGVLTYAISNLIFPSISRLAAAGRKDELATVIAKAVKIVIAVLLPVMLLFLLLRTPLVRFVYERGEFTAESTALTASALLFYSLGMVGFGISEILNKAFYALKDGKTPMLVATGGIALNVMLSILFIRGLKTGLWGLPLAASIAANLIGLVLLLLIQKQLKLVRRADLVNIAKLVLAAAVMGVVVYAVLHTFTLGDSFIARFMQLAIPAAIGCVVYLVLLFLFKTEEAQDLIDILRKKGKKVA